MQQGAGIVFWVGFDLGEGDIASRIYEFAKFAIGDRRAVHKEAVHRHAMDRRFLRIMLVGSHAKRTARDKNHVAMRHAARRRPTLLDVFVEHRHATSSLRFAFYRQTSQKTLPAPRIGIIPAMPARGERPPRPRRSPR